MTARRKPRPGVDQLSLDLGEPEDWARLETHVADGVFCPPTIEDASMGAINRLRRPPRRELRPALVPASLLRRCEDGSYRTTLLRLRDYAFCTLVTILDDGEEVAMELERVERRGGDWASMLFREVAGDRRLEVLNSDPLPHRPGDDVRIVSRGTSWEAVFEGPEARRRVQRAGFRFDPEDRTWTTMDPRAAAGFDPELRRSLERQRRMLEQPERRPAPSRAEERRRWAGIRGRRA